MKFVTSDYNSCDVTDNIHPFQLGYDPIQAFLHIRTRCSCRVNNEISFSDYYSRNIVSNLPLMDHTHSRILLETFDGETTELGLHIEVLNPS